MRYTGSEQTASSLSEAVLDAVATEKGVEPPELLTPLFDVIDPDALDNLFRGNRNGHLSFSYAGYAVTAHSNGEVDLQPVRDE